MRSQALHQLLRQHGRPVLVAFARPDDQLAALQVHVLNPQSQQLVKPQPAAAGR